MKKFVAIFLLFASAGILFSSCKKEYNSTVNQAYAFTATIPNSTWQLSTDNYLYGIKLDDLSFVPGGFIGATDAVLVYVDYNNDGTYDGPLEMDYGAYKLRSYHDNNTIGVELYALDGGTLNSSDLTAAFPKGSATFKIVLIQNADLGDLSSKVNINDYNAVKKAFNLK